MNEDLLKEVEKINTSISMNQKAIDSLNETNQQLLTRRTGLEKKLDKNTLNQSAAEQYLNATYKRESEK